MFLHIFRHIETNDGIAAAEHLLRQTLREVGLAHTRRTEEEESTDRTARVAQAETRAANGTHDGIDGFVLTDNPLAQSLVHSAQPLRFRFLHTLYGYARHHRNHGGNIVHGDGIRLLRFVAYRLGTRVRPCTRLVHHIDGFVGKSAVGKVTFRQADRCLQGLFRIDNVVIFRVMLTQTIEDREGLFRGGRTDNHFLETAFQRPVFLYRSAILVGSGGPNTLHLATRQSGFEDIRRIQRTLCVPRTDDGMYLVDKEDYFRVALQLLQHRFHTFLELTAVGGTRHHRRHIEGDDTFARKSTRLVANDTQSESLYDSRLADTRFADEDRVVLLASGEDLHHTLYLHLAPNDGVEFARLRLFGKVVSVLVECGSSTDLAPIGLRATGFAVFNITPLPHSCGGGLSGGVRLGIEFDYPIVGDSPRIRQIECGTVDTVAQNSQQQVGTTDGIRLILTADALGDTHDTLHLRTAGNRFDSVALILLQSGIEVSFGFFCREPRLTEKVIRLTFRQAQDTQNEVFGQYLCVLQTLRFVAGVNQDFI